MVRSPRRVLAEYHLRPKKRYGQHFLTDTRIAQQIVRASGATGDDVVVEVGAGLGALTELLLRVARRVVALEVDPALGEALRRELAAPERLTVLTEDALAFDFRGEALRAGRPLLVLGNLPYQIAAPLLFRLLDARAAVASATLMVQEEVAERLVAAPGSGAYGPLTIAVSLWADVSLVLRVPARVFYPEPDVDGALVRVVPRAEPRVPLPDPRLFDRIMRAAFAHRRKTLRNNLRILRADAGALLARAGLDPRRRAETLTLAEFAALAQAWRTVR